jgi:hypothetical protein
MKSDTLKKQKCSNPTSESTQMRLKTLIMETHNCVLWFQLVFCTHEGVGRVLKVQKNKIGGPSQNPADKTGTSLSDTNKCN